MDPWARAGEGGQGWETLESGSELQGEREVLGLGVARRGGSCEGPIGRGVGERACLE